MDHLTDLARLEWARFGETRLAPEPSDHVRGHLDACAACRETVDAFAALERSMWAYGDPPPKDPLPGRFRLALKIGALVLAVALITWWIL